ncbi:MAG: hypothetical protein ACKVWV_01585, partial [Planctomycetota bacterium]
SPPSSALRRHWSREQLASVSLRLTVGECVVERPEVRLATQIEKQRSAQARRTAGAVESARGRRHCRALP